MLAIVSVYQFIMQSPIMQRIMLSYFIEDIDNELNIMMYINKTTVFNHVLAGIKLLKCSWMKPKIITTEKWLNEYDDHQFFKLFRMRKITLEKLEQLVSTSDTEKSTVSKYKGGHHPIDLRSQILVFIWYMATQDTLISIGTRFKISPTSVMNVVNKILFFMLKLKKTVIKFPSRQELHDVAEGFPRYPGTIGALDGTHIFVKVPNNQADSYTDRYRRQSINIMAICDSRRILTYVFVGFPGSAHDARVFDNSLFNQEIQNHGPNVIFEDCEKFHLIADSAFPLKMWLMTPYRDNKQMTRVQKKHNKCLSSERVVIEHVFGLLKGRWRRLQFINTYNICKTVEIALAGCVLHNFCLTNEDFWNEEIGTEEDLFQNQEEQFPSYDQRAARRKRDNIANVVNQRN